MTKNNKKENICLKHNCYECCNPVKMKIGAETALNGRGVPFRYRKEIIIPESHPDTVRLEAFDCKLFDCEKGRCGDYENRPDICKNTECAAFETDDEEEQKKIINEIKSENFMKLKLK